MSAFEDCFTELLGSEGGYSNNPLDPGGETMYGITKRTALRHGYTGAMKDLPKELAYSIGCIEYWKPHSCDQMDVRIAYQVLDAAYNGGHPAEWLQQCVGVHVDGDIGAATIAAVRSANIPKVVGLFNALRLEYMAIQPGTTFDDGWMNRIAKCIRIGVKGC